MIGVDLEPVCSEPCGCWVGGGPVVTEVEINEAVARKLGIGFEGSIAEACHGHICDYATCIEAAFGLVPRLPEFRLRLIPSDHSDHGLESWGASYWLDGQWREVVSGTAAKAICLAFLDLPSV